MHNASMNNLNKTPKQLIDEIRASTGMTDTSIADATNISQSTISRLRSGTLKDTSSENWRSIVSLYETKVQRVIERRERRKPACKTKT